MLTSVIDIDVDIGDACAATAGSKGSSRGKRDTNSDNHRYRANVEQNLVAAAREL